MTIAIPTRRKVELCPRSYDVIQRAELDDLYIRFDAVDVPTVSTTASTLNSRVKHLTTSDTVWQGKANRKRGNVVRFHQ